MNKYLAMFVAMILGVILFTGTPQAVHAADVRFSIACSTGDCSPYLAALGQYAIWEGEEWNASTISGAEILHVMSSKEGLLGMGWWTPPFPPCTLGIYQTYYDSVLGRTAWDYQYVDGNGNFANGAAFCANFLSGSGPWGANTGKWWVMGNEPNGTYAWGGDTMTPSQFADFVTESTGHLLALDPTAHVVIGGIIGNSDYMFTSCDGWTSIPSSGSYSLKQYFDEIGRNWRLYFGTAFPNYSYASHNYGWAGDVLYQYPSYSPRHINASRLVWELGCVHQLLASETSIGNLVSNKINITELGVNPTACRPDACLGQYTSATVVAFMQDFFYGYSGNKYPQDPAGSPGLLAKTTEYNVESWFWWSWDGLANPGAPEALFSSNYVLSSAGTEYSCLTAGSMSC